LGFTAWKKCPAEELLEDNLPPTPGFKEPMLSGPSFWAWGKIDGIFRKSSKHQRSDAAKKPGVLGILKVRTGMNQEEETIKIMMGGNIAKINKGYDIT
jgi:hypothetical protein